MTLLSRKADYALLILAYLHRHPDGGNARTVAEAYGLSHPFAANILKELCHNGFVASHRGAKGGYVLQKPPAEIRLAELLEALEEGFRLTQCAAPGEAEEACSLEPVCPVKGPLSEIHRRLTDVLRGVTLAELFDPPGLAAVPGHAAQTLLPLLPARGGPCCSAPAGCREHPSPA